MNDLDVSMNTDMRKASAAREYLSAAFAELQAHIVARNWSAIESTRSKAHVAIDDFFDSMASMNKRIEIEEQAR